MTINFTDNYIQSHSHSFMDVPDLERAFYVLQVWQSREPNANPYRFMKEYMIRREAVTWMSQNILGSLPIEVAPEEKTEKRKDKYARLERLALDNLYKEFTTQELVDASGLGAQTVVLWAKTEGFFRAVPDVRGKWEARNPKDDRKHA